MIEMVSRAFWITPHPLGIRASEGQGASDDDLQDLLLDRRDEGEDVADDRREDAFDLRPATRSGRRRSPGR